MSTGTHHNPNIRRRHSKHRTPKSKPRQQIKKKYNNKPYPTNSIVDSRRPSAASTAPLQPKEGPAGAKKPGFLRRFTLLWKRVTRWRSRNSLLKNFEIVSISERRTSGTSARSAARRRERDERRVRRQGVIFRGDGRVPLDEELYQQYRSW
ncbi:hypothetical protein CYLTODRAFT_493628 [Cylindrobasidium torrendii FP15055 ss-10]|uniref:Uncharacterized protein n=1 Tax=Cylindrobasidium torrendii FP15055 ss-10 TaxID=1314674 RepID=A0A0D7B2N1_9AGAR|nr:hypothetical protein CYLTODRAFT_493628 [Cylindrobasidium torrendii FP15055 ss-10]